MLHEDYHKSKVGEDGEVPLDALGSPPQTEMGSFLYSGPSTDIADTVSLPRRPRVHKHPRAWHAHLPTTSRAPEKNLDPLHQAPSAGTVRGAHGTPPRRGGSGCCGSASAHTRKGHAGTTRRATGPSARNAQTAWNGVPAREGKGHPDRTARHTQRGTRGAGRGKRERHNTRYRPEPPAPAASAAHKQTGHCTRQGSSGAQRHTPTSRLGSLRASPRGSHWRQASSTGPAAPAPRATTH